MKDFYNFKKTYPLENYFFITHFRPSKFELIQNQNVYL